MIASFFVRLLLFFCLGSLSLLLTDNFRLSKIALCDTHSPSDIPLTPEIRSLLNQPFHYLAKGSQSYVFASEDGRYVLKLFKDPRKHLRSWTWLGSNLLKKGPRWIWKTLHSDKRAKKWERHLCSLHLAAALASEAGLVYAHLEGTTHLQVPITLTDKIGISHTLSLDTVPLVIQKRAQPLEKYLHTLKTAEDAAQCQAAASKLLQSLEEKGLLYTDGKMENWGIVDGAPILLDLGCIQPLTAPARR